MRHIPGNAYRCSVPRLTRFTALYCVGPAHQHLNITYLFEADENDAIHILEDENSNIGWLTFNELISKSDEPYMIPVYEKIVEKIKQL